MISLNDLYDISFALQLIRSDIQNEHNRAILYKIEQVLKKKSDTEDNQIRTAISSIDNLDREQWRYVYHNNLYVNHRTLKNEHIYRILITMCDAVIFQLENQDFKRAYDLVDCFHCLPDIIANNNFKIPRTYWKRYISKYRRKWDRTFLKHEEKDYKTSHPLIS